MRRITTTLVLALIAVAATAGHRDASDMVLTTHDHGSFTVRLDGQVYQAYNQLELEEITPGRHSIRVDRKRQSQHGYGGRGTILYNGFIDIPASSELHVLVINRHTLQVDVSPLYADCSQGCSINACTCEVEVAPVFTDPCGNGAWNLNPWHENYYGAAVYTGYGQTTCGNSYGNYGQYGSNGQYGNAQYSGIQYGNNWTSAMTQQGFTAFRRSLQDMNFESAKLSAIENQLLHARFTAAQTRTLMSLFSFDSSKLDLAKMIYPTVIDPSKYYLVADGFTFNSTREELYHFMQA